MVRLFAALAILAVAVPARADFIDLYANKLDMPRNKAPRIGRSNVLVVPVQIDFGTYQGVDMDRLHAFFEGPVDGPSLTFGKYFGMASGGRYQPVATVAPLVRYTTCPSMIKTPDCTIARGDISALNQGIDFVRDVFRRAHEENGLDLRKFDINGLGETSDGIIDGVMIVVNVPHIGIALPIQYLNGGANLSGTNGGAFVLDGVEIPYVAIGGASFPNGEQHLEYVALHEFSHTLGMADLYYEHPSSAADKYPSWGGLHYSLMGDYEYGPEATLPDAESRRALGWQIHSVVSGTQTLTLRAAADGGYAVKLGMMNAGRKEYFLAEVRGPGNGMDGNIQDRYGDPTWGLALYHVDWSIGPKADLGAWTSRMVYCLDCDPFHPFIQNVQSDGRFSLVDGAADSVRSGGIADDYVLWSGGAISSINDAPPLADTARYVATNYYDGTPSGIAIRDIHVNADHSVTATFVAPEVQDPCADVACTATEACQKSGPFAGNCLPYEPQVEPGPTRPPVAGETGCTSAGAPGLAGLLLAAWAMRRTRRNA